MMSRYSSGLRECECCFRALNARILLNREYRMIIIAVYSLAVAHPGPGFGSSTAAIYESDVAATSDGFTEKAEPGMSITQHAV